MRLKSPSPIALTFGREHPLIYKDAFIPHVEAFTMDRVILQGLEQLDRRRPSADLGAKLSAGDCRRRSFPSNIAPRMSEDCITC